VSAWFMPVCATGLLFACPGPIMARFISTFFVLLLFYCKNEAIVDYFLEG
jgi:hypothetical protein